MQDGDRDALNELVPLVYDDLKDVARGQRRRWRVSSMQTTSLLHEAYLRLVGQKNPDWKDRAHFLAVAATAMRQILIDHARKRDAKKRGGDRQKVSFEEIEALLASPADDEGVEVRDELLLMLENALTRLEAIKTRPVRVVECRFFAGMTIPETATALDLSASSVSRSWAMARAWLYNELRAAADGGAAEESPAGVDEDRDASVE